MTNLDKICVLANWGTMDKLYVVDVHITCNDAADGSNRVAVYMARKENSLLPDLWLFLLLIQYSPFPYYALFFSNNVSPIQVQVCFNLTNHTPDHLTSLFKFYHSSHSFRVKPKTS